MSKSKKPRYRHNGNATEIPTLGEFPGVKRISKTIPNQGMTVRELIIRFASGLPVAAGKVPIYEGDTDLPDIDKMDLIELDAYAKELAAEKREAEAAHADRNKKAQNMRLEKVIAERLEKKRQEEEKAEFEQWRKTKGGNNG